MESVVAKRILGLSMNYAIALHQYCTERDFGKDQATYLEKMRLSDAAYLDLSEYLDEQVNKSLPPLIMEKL